MAAWSITSFWDKSASTGFRLQLRERLIMVEMKIKTSQIPSERTAQGQRDECRQQEVSDSVEVKWREGHHGNGQGQREAGSQRQEFAERDQEKVGWTIAAGWQISWGRYVLVNVSSYLLLSFKVLQLISSMYTTIRGTVCGQQGSGSNWAEYLQRITSYTLFLCRSSFIPPHHRTEH